MVAVKQPLKVADGKYNVKEFSESVAMLVITIKPYEYHTNNI